MKTTLDRKASECRGYALMEALVYIGVVTLLLGIGSAAVYRCIDASVALRRSAEDISAAVSAGERWRADIRAAKAQPRLENADPAAILHITAANGEVTYLWSASTVLRRVNSGPWQPVLKRVASSKMRADPRKNITAWTWECELEPSRKGTVNAAKMRPLFTFVAVPQSL